LILLRTEHGRWKFLWLILGKWSRKTIGSIGICMGLLFTKREEVPEWFDPII